MEYAQTSSTVESSFVEKNTIIKTCKNNLLVDFKNSIPLLLSGRYVIARKHFIKNKKSSYGIRNCFMLQVGHLGLEPRTSRL